MIFAGYFVISVLILSLLSAGAILLPRPLLSAASIILGRRLFCNVGVDFVLFCASLFVISLNETVGAFQLDEQILMEKLLE